MIEIIIFFGNFHFAKIFQDNSSNGMMTLVLSSPLCFFSHKETLYMSLYISIKFYNCISSIILKFHSEVGETSGGTISTHFS